MLSVNLLRQCSRQGRFQLPTKYFRQFQIRDIHLKSSHITKKHVVQQFDIVRHLSTSTINLRPEKVTSDQQQKLLKVYYGVLTPQIRAVKVFSLTSSILGVIAQPILLEKGSQIGGIPMVVALCGFVGFFTFVTPLLLHWITKKYITELHYDEQKDEYIATTITFFLRQKKVGLL
jgi:hypothetical protein